MDNDEYLASNSILIECILVPDRPNAIGFTFEAEDGKRITPQQIIDAMSEYLIMADERFLPRDLVHREDSH